jgi:hypothetical protein
VYEATAYAVPFLIELAASPLTPDRLGILQLLAAIASGSPSTARADEPRIVTNEDRQARELPSIGTARAAVARGFDTLASLMSDNSAAVRLAAAHVLAQLPERAAAVAAILRDRLNAETNELFRAGYLLLLGEAGDRSEPTIASLAAGLSTDDRVQRRAAALALARLRPDPLPGPARDAILDLVGADDVEEDLADLPWDVSAELDPGRLLACLDAAARESAADELIHRIQSGSTTGNHVTTLLELLFPRGNGMAPWRPGDISPLQTRAVRAMAMAMEGGRRIFYGHFPQWGLPDTISGWRDLAQGKERIPTDMTFPILGDIDNPRRALRPDRLVSGQRVHHRAFGPGTVSRASPFGSSVRVLVQFDIEGAKSLLLPPDGGISDSALGS